MASTPETHEQHRKQVPSPTSDRRESMELEAPRRWAAGSARAWRAGVPVTEMTQIVREMGGPKHIGELLTVSHSTVCSWQRRGTFPSGQAAKLIILFPNIDPLRISRLALQKKIPVPDL